MENIYIHTIEGRPAYYSEKDSQIVFCGWRGMKLSRCCESLSEIRKQQKFSNDYRNKNNFPIDKQHYFILRNDL